MAKNGVKYDARIPDTRCSRLQLKQIIQAAAKSEMKTSEWIRRTLVSAAKRQLKCQLHG